MYLSTGGGVGTQVLHSLDGRHVALDTSVVEMRMFGTVAAGGVVSALFGFIEPSSGQPYDGDWRTSVGEVRG